MKKFLSASPLLVLLACLAFAPGARAQLSLRVTATPSTLAIGGAVTYSITVSNTSIVQVQSLEVQSTFPPGAGIVRAVNNYTATGVATNAGAARFNVSVLPGRTAATMVLELRPAARGNFANNFVAVASGTPTVSTNVVVSVGQAQVDLAVGVEGFPTNILVGDEFDYTVTVTNFGPAIADSVNIQSVLPSGMQFLSVFPAIPNTFNNTTRILSLSAGSITNDTARDFIVRLQANTNGAPNLITSVVTADNTDTKSSNDSFTNALTVLPFVTNRIAILSVSPQKFNRQNALIEQLVILTNLTTNVIQDVRLLVTNLAVPNQLFNATGTNAGRPYVIVAGGLAPTNTAAVLLQFYSPQRDTNNSTVLAVEGPDLNPLTYPAGGAAVPIVRFVQLRTAYDPARPKQMYSSIYIEFVATAGRTYSLVYKTSLDDANWIAAQPPVVANSSFGQFVDPGPQVSGVGDRFYWVIEHP